MLRPIIKVFVLILLMSQEANVFGMLTTLRGSTNRDKKRVICLSEDDEGALVWNANLTYQYYRMTYIVDPDAKQFFSTCPQHDKSIDCKLNNEYGCLTWWNKEDWRLTNSFSTPMGLVFDQRWEEFEEHSYDANKTYALKLDNTNIITLPFSVRAMRDMHILICDIEEPEEYKTKLCYWLIIGGWINTRSVIRKCSTGVPPIGEFPEIGSECETARDTLYHTPLAEYEWRSFVLTWNSQTRNISLYDSDQMIITYRDTEKYENINSTYRLLIRSPLSIFIRYHDYYFLYTSSRNAILTSNIFNVNTNTICLQMLIGLCAECDVDVSLHTFTDEVVKTITVKGSLVMAVYDLPMWQFVKLMVNTTTHGYSDLKIVVTPKLSLVSSNPIWAIANVRQCPLHGCLRESAITINRDYKETWKSDYFWPNVTCQKLFYGEQSVVHPFNSADLNVELDDKNCPVGYIGPKCKFNCNTTLDSKYNCKNVIICNNNGCTCSPGHRGPKCGAFCEQNFYGHACKQRCGLCRQGKQCNRISGVCDDGCAEMENYYYAPPLCQIGVDKPNEIQFNFTNQTIIIVTVPIKWEKKYEEINFLYTFKIITENRTFVHQNEWKRVLQNSEELIDMFENLKPGISYQIQCIFNINNFLIRGDWKSVDTHCNPVKNFYIMPDETSLEIIANESQNQLYPCPINSYDVLIKNTDNQDERRIGLIPSFPYTLSNLSPYTSYKVTILNRGKNLFSWEVRTLEGVPSEVLFLQAMPLSSTNVSLLWESPERPNGIIEEYAIHLMIVTYFGCKYVRSSSNNYTIVERTNKTEITLSGLHAYAKYSVQVIAHNSRYASKPAMKMFSLPEHAIPAVTFSELKMEGWILSWNLPKDCTAILGPLEVARIEIQGISDAVKNFTLTKNTKFYSIDLQNQLYGAEQYIVKIFALRDYNRPINISVYEEYKVDTPPKEPPEITNLEVVEVENKTLFLRWQSPHPPLNGELRGYSIFRCYFTKKCDKIEVQLNETCSLWNNYICKTVDYPNSSLQVVAYNAGVATPSNYVSVTREMLNNRIPDVPRNFTYSIGNNSVVNLKWLHPCRTGRHLLHFNVTIEKITSNLKGHAKRSIENNSRILSVANYNSSYSMQLPLLPSTQYNISVKSVTVEKKESNISTVDFWTPSTMNFSGELTYKVQESDSTITVTIPDIVNDTRSGMLYIIVKGQRHDCVNYVQPHKNLWELAGVQENDIFWQAVAVSTRNTFKGMAFILGSINEKYGNATNCPLLSGELYHIAVIINEQDFNYKPIAKKITTSIGEKLTSSETWLIPIFIILVVAAAAFYFFRRKRQKLHKELMLQDEMVLSQNIETYEHDTKSVISDSKQQAPSTPSDRQSLSRSTTPEITTIAVGNNDEEKEVTSLVKVKDFEDYVRQAIDSGLLDRQYETFPRGQTQPWDYGKLPQNKTKNRYGNLIAYDKTRVILNKLPDDAYSDYINANYITGYKKKKRYIATQGPKPNTVVDFWHMIWQEKVLIICMLANVVENGKTKCEQYWPDIGKKKRYGEIIVLNATHNVFADYCFRILHVTYGKETRKVEHLHYTAWPDHGVPMYTHSVVTYLKKLLATPPGDGPVVVHCSAGVGRTGTIILCDICLHRAAAEGVVDVFAETASIRCERANMVDNKQQYLLAHLALVECLLTIPTTLPCNETLPTRIKELKKQLSVQQQRLQNTAWQDEALRPVTIPLSLSERNRAKNRFPELISDKVSRIYLNRYPISDEDSDYLSAVYVDGVKLQNQYLATQLPMPLTIKDFWRMIAELKVELIVMLQPPDPEDSTCCAVAPASGEFKPTPFLNITAKEIVELENYTLQKLFLVNNSEKPPREQSVTILCCTEWKPGKNQPPPSVMTMVTFWQATERIARGDGPTVTLCHDGVTGCGLYLALSFMLERMAVERECDVCLAVRAVRRSRSDFVRSLEHLEYLYDAAMTYLEYFETYANFS